MAEEPNETKKKSLAETIEEHPRTVFWIRFFAWCLFAAVLPFLFIAWRYGIFSKASAIKLSGWGFIAIIIVIVFIITLISYLYKGMKPGLAKQCVTGFVKIILPLTILLLLVVSIEDSIKLFKQALCCVILCEIIGIPLNPLPDWLEKRKKEQHDEKIETVSDVFWDKFFNRKDKENKE